MHGRLKISPQHNRSLVLKHIIMVNHIYNSVKCKNFTFLHIIYTVGKNDEIFIGSTSMIGELFWCIKTLVSHNGMGAGA